MSNFTVAIAGFSGKMSQLITDALLKNHPSINIHGIARDLSKVKPKYEQVDNIKLFESSATDHTRLANALEGADVCICGYLGDDTLMIDGQKLLIDVCIEKGVAKYIASDWSLDYNGLEYGDHPSKDAMKHVAAYLKERSNKIRAAHILNGVFMEVLFAPFLGYYDPQKRVFRYFGSGDERIDTTTMADAAMFTAEVALDEAATGIFEFLGDSKSVKELAATWGQVYGTNTTAERAGSMEDLRVMMKEAREKDPKNPFSWMGLCYQYWMAQDSTRLHKINNKAYPDVKPISTEYYLRQHDETSVVGVYFGK